MKLNIEDAEDIANFEKLLIEKSLEISEEDAKSIKIANLLQLFHID